MSVFVAIFKWKYHISSKWCIKHFTIMRLLGCFQCYMFRDNAAGIFTHMGFFSSFELLPMNILKSELGPKVYINIFFLAIYYYIIFPKIHNHFQSISLSASPQPFKNEHYVGLSVKFMMTSKCIRLCNQHHNTALLHF